MWKILIKIFEKFACNHDWVSMVDEYEDRCVAHDVVVNQHKMLLKCKRCGKLKKIVI